MPFELYLLFSSAKIMQTTNRKDTFNGWGIERIPRTPLGRVSVVLLCGWDPTSSALSIQHRAPLETEDIDR